LRAFSIFFPDFFILYPQSPTAASLFRRAVV
jgi:hypothetical protein